MKNVANYYLNNFKVTSGFGVRQGASLHGGLDLANGKQGDSVKSLMSGVVKRAYYSASGGYMVVVEQSDGIIAKYMHMQEDLKVKPGDRVESGTELGSVGNTGFSSGAHLHIQVEQNGQKFDPMKYLNELSSAS